MPNSVRIPFPHKGKDENWAESGQPPLTSPDLQNVRPRDVQDKRSRGGQRPAVRKVMYWWDYIGSGSDLGLPDPSPIIGQAQVTAVYYASVAGGDPGPGDPGWDGIVLLMKYDYEHEVQLYSFAGDFISEIAPSHVSQDGENIELDNEGNIYTYIAQFYEKYHYDGTYLAGNTSSHGNGTMVPTNRNDKIMFRSSIQQLTAYTNYETATFLPVIWTKNYSQGHIRDIIQLENSDDLLISFSLNYSGSIKRVSRVDGAVITTYSGMSTGAWSIAVDETNGWVYKVGGYGADALNKVYRCDLSDGGNITSYTIADDSAAITAWADAGGGKVTATSVGHGLINGNTVTITGTTNYNGTFIISNKADDTFEIVDTWVIGSEGDTGTWQGYTNAKKVRLYGGKVYVCGHRATDNKSVWRLDAGLTAIEADYDTGETVNDMRILADGTVYVVGVSGTNEDSDTGNVNVLDEDLVYIESWNVRTAGEIISIAEKI